MIVCLKINMGVIEQFSYPRNYRCKCIRASKIINVFCNLAIGLQTQYFHNRIVTANTSTNINAKDIMIARNRVLNIIAKVMRIVMGFPACADVHEWDPMEKRLSS